MVERLEEAIKNQFPFLKEDFAERASRHLASQYSESDKFKATIKAFVAETDRMKDAIVELLTLRWIDTARGKNLDVIGELVGQPRVSVDAPFYFGYAASSIASGYGAGRYKTSSEPLTGKRIVADPEYRLFIKSKAFGNKSRSTLAELQYHIYYVLNRATFVINGQAEIRIYFTEILNRNEIAVLNFQWIDSRGQERDFFSHTLGVGRKIFYELPTDKVFAYAANPIASGYGVGAYARRIA